MAVRGLRFPLCLDVVVPSGLFVGLGSDGSVPAFVVDAPRVGGVIQVHFADGAVFAERVFGIFLLGSIRRWLFG